LIIGSVLTSARNIPAIIEKVILPKHLKIKALTKQKKNIKATTVLVIGKSKRIKERHEHPAITPKDTPKGINERCMRFNIFFITEI